MTYATLGDLLAARKRRKVCAEPGCGKAAKSRFCAMHQKRRERAGLKVERPGTYREKLVEAALRLADAEGDSDFAHAAEALEQIARRGRAA